MVDGTQRLLPQLRELILDGVDRAPGDLYINAFDARLLPESGSWLLGPEIARLETLQLCNVYLLGEDDLQAIKQMVDSAPLLPHPKSFSLILDMESDDESGSEIY